jgi:hypothetical protein
MRQTASERHARGVNRSHLGGQHGFDLVARLDPFDDRSQQPLLLLLASLWT